jgi:hypothetical protein
LHYPKYLGAAATYLTFVVDYAIEDCLRADQQTRENQRKWHVPEVLFQSITQPAKSASENQQDQAKKKQNTKLDGVFKVIEDLLNCCPM